MPALRDRAGEYHAIMVAKKSRDLTCISIRWGMYIHPKEPAEMNYDGFGRFIYGACRYGGNEADVVNWMADELGVARPSVEDEPAKYGLYDAFLTRYCCAGELEDGFTRFMANFTTPGA
ncbi:MAG: hypothetical protein ABWY27_07520 [Telluria sp.]